MVGILLLWELLSAWPRSSLSKMIGLTPLTLVDILAEETEKVELAGVVSLTFYPCRDVTTGKSDIIEEKTAPRMRPTFKENQEEQFQSRMGTGSRSRYYLCCRELVLPNFLCLR